jgi:flagellar operon protein
MSYRLINGRAYSLEGIEQVKNTPNSKNINKDKIIDNKASSFKDILNTTIKKEDNFTVSKHAAQRLNEINFTDEDMKKVKEGFKIAEEKKSKNVVMIYKDTALIASVENKTIITAVNKERGKENIFTNIDSVVIL